MVLQNYEKVEPGANGTDGADGTCIGGNSEIGEESTEELGECNGVDAEERASGEREGGEREGKEVRCGIKVRVLHSARAAKFKHDPV